MKYRFHPFAAKELDDAVNYYKDLESNLGLEFLEEFYSSIQRILGFPSAWSKLSNNCRQCILNRFPYGIIYFIEEEIIYIVAVMQLNRQPNYWENRI